MPWRGAEYEGEMPSLGWQLIDIWTDVFPSPRDEGSPLVLTDEQALLIVEWYSLDPLTGRFVYRRGISRKAKGTGKSPLEAAKCISELALPVRFDGWDAHGEPVGRPWGTGGDPAPWIQIAALSEDQDDNTYSPLHNLLTANDGRAADALGIDAGLTRCFLRNKPAARIEPVTSKAGSKEGQPVTYGCLDETGLMTAQNGGVKLAATIRRNTTKMGGRSYETTNGYRPGEASVAEATERAIEKGASGILHDAVEAPVVIDGIEVNADAPDDILRRALAEPYKGCWWVDIDRIVADARDPDTEWSDAERFFFNWNRKSESAGVDPKRWLALHNEYLPPAGSYVALGFDGSINDDSTALIGALPTGHLFEIHVWERPKDAPRGWRVPRSEVHDMVEEAFAYYRVGRMFCDPAKWWTEIEGWAARWNPQRDEDAVVIMLDTNQTSRFAPACDRLATAVAEGRVSWQGEILSRHTLAMARKKVRIRDADDDGRTRFVFVKADTRKIDGGIGGTLALEAAMTMPPEPADSVPLVAWR